MRSRSKKHAIEKQERSEQRLRAEQGKIRMNRLQELYFRHKMCDFCIRQLMEDDVANDPRQPAALENYKGQLAEIDKEITLLEKEERQANGLPEPEPVVVGLKTAVLFGKAQ